MPITKRNGGYTIRKPQTKPQTKPTTKRGSGCNCGGTKRTK